MAAERDRSENQTGVPQIEVTPEMIEAGMEELKEHSLAGDMRAMVSEVYSAMECERLASVNKQ